MVYCGWVLLVDARADPKKPKMQWKQQFGSSVVLLTLILRDGPYVCIFSKCVSLSFLGSLSSHLYTPFTGIC